MIWDILLAECCWVAWGGVRYGVGEWSNAVNSTTAVFITQWIINAANVDWLTLSLHRHFPGQRFAFKVSLLFILFYPEFINDWSLMGMEWLGGRRLAVVGWCGVANECMVDCLYVSEMDERKLKAFPFALYVVWTNFVSFFVIKLVLTSPNDNYFVVWMPFLAPPRRFDVSTSPNNRWIVCFMYYILTSESDNHSFV